MNLSALNKAKADTAPLTSGISVFDEIELTLIIANPNQPRKSFEEIEELANSIRDKGLIQPIAVVKKGIGYMIISGERRYRACVQLEMRTIKAHVLSADDKTVQELALIENIQREDLTDFEKAKFIAQLWASGHYPQKQDLAAAIGKSASYLSKAFSTLHLDQEILTSIEETKQDIPLSVLDEIARVKDPTVQKEVYKQYTAKEITRDEIKGVVEKGGKISRGKKDTTSFELEGHTAAYLLSSYIKREFPLYPNRKYKITIEEV